MSVRPQRVASEIQKVLSAKLLRLPAFLTILEVQVSKDLSAAKIYFSLFGERKQCEDTLSILQESKKDLRKEIARQVKLRITPELQWIRDNTPEKADRINKLIGVRH